MATKPKTKKASTKKVAKTQPKQNIFCRGRAKVCTYRKEKPAYFITWIVIGLILIGIAAWAGAVAYERYQLNQAEKTLDTLAYDIKDALGEPISITKEKSCSYPSTKMETIGRKPNCRVSYRLIYQEFTVEDIDEIATKVEPMVQEVFKDSSLEIEYGSYGDGITNPFDKTKYGQSADKTNNGLLAPNCSVSIYNIDKEGIVKVEPYGVIRLSCYRTTLIKHF